MIGRPLSRPTFASGWASSPARSAFPSHWVGLQGLWMPSMGVQGIKLIDFSKKGFNMAFQNGVYWATGDGSTGLQYTGTNYTNTAIGSAHLIAFGTADFSFCARFKAATSTDYETVCAFTNMGNFNGDPRYGFQINPSTDGTNPNKIYAFVGVTGTASSLSPITVTGTGKWHSVVGVRRAGTIYCYVDGIRAPGAAAGSYNLTTPGNSAFKIGRSWDNYVYGLHGTVDDVRVYNRALTETEISEIARGANPLIPRVDMAFKKSTSVLMTRRTLNSLGTRAGTRQIQQ